MNFTSGFSTFAKRSAVILGTPQMFVANVFLILLWLGTGPFFHFSDTWQLVINTATTVFTYLAVFLIQNTQNRDAKAMHLKLDELITSIEGARNRFVNLENLSEPELKALEKQFEDFHHRSNQNSSDATRAIGDELDKEKPART